MNRPTRPRFEDHVYSDSGQAAQPPSDALRQKVRELRNELSRDVSGVQQDVKQLFDWKGQLKKRPYIALGAVAALGYLLAPRSKKAIEVSEEQLKKLLKSGDVKINVTPETSPSSGVTSSLLAALGAVATRAAAGYVASQFGPSNDSVPPEVGPQAG